MHAAAMNAPKFTIPLRVFLQLCLGAAAGVLALALSLLLVGFSSEATRSIGTLLADAASKSAALRCNDRFLALGRASVYINRQFNVLDSASTNCSGALGFAVSCEQLTLGNLALRTLQSSTNTSFVTMVVCDTAAQIGAYLETTPNSTLLNFTFWQSNTVTLTYVLNGATGSVTSRASSVTLGELTTKCSAPVDSVAFGTYNQTWLSFVPTMDKSGALAAVTTQVKNRVAVMRYALYASDLFRTSKTTEAQSWYAAQYTLAVESTRTVMLQYTEEGFASGNAIQSSSPVSAVGGSMFVGRALIDVDSLFSQIRQGLMIVVIVTVGISVAIAAASSLVVLFVTRPVTELSEGLSAIGRLDVDGVHVRSSFITEIEEISALTTELTAIVRELRHYLPEDELESSSVDLDASLDDLHMQPTMQILKTRVHLVYEDRATAREIAVTAFDFMYTETEPDLFERLVRESKESCGEDQFERVSVCVVNDSGDRVELKHSMQVQELLATAPAQVDVFMERVSAPRYGIVFSAALNLLNAVTTISYASYLLRSGVDKTVSIPFICLYFFALSLNFSLALVLLRRGSTNADFDLWLQDSSAEVATCLAVCVSNLQDMEILWSFIRVGQLRFNAPDNPALLQRSVSLSVFGFLFSDVAQLLFKIWLVSNGSVDEFSFVALVTSSLSVLFNLIFKLHAMILWQSTPTVDENAYLRDAQTDAGTLVPKDVSLVMTQFHLPSSVRQLPLQALEMNEHYRMIDDLSRQYGGTNLTMQAGCVLVAFNVTRRTEAHAECALAFATSVRQATHRAGRPTVCAIGSGRMLVGMLGTITVKTMHCFGDADSLARQCAVGFAAGLHTVMSRDTLLRLGVEWQQGDVVIINIQSEREHRTSETVEVALGCPTTLTSNATVASSKSTRKQRRGTTLDMNQQSVKDTVVGIVVSSDVEHAPDLRLPELTAAFGALAMEDVMTGAERFLRDFNALQRQRQKSAMAELNVYGLSTINARHIIDFDDDSDDGEG